VADVFVNTRLFGPLKVAAGRRQFVLTGQIEDYFMIDWYHGLHPLDKALEIFAAKRGYDVAVFLDSEGRLRFPTPEMEALFETTARRTSDDPQRGERQPRRFQPRARANEPPPANTPPSGTDRAANDSAGQAATAASQVSAAASNTLQTTLDQITRMLQSKHKTIVVVRDPELIVGLQPGQEDLRRLNTIIGWCRVPTGHRESCSLLVINKERLEYFSNLARARGIDRANYTQDISVDRPDRQELACFLERLLGRYCLNGFGRRLAATAHARELSLYNFACLVSDYLAQTPRPDSLDQLFADGEQAKTLEELLQELDDLIGLDDVKKKVRELADVARDEAERRRAGADIEPMSHHMFFLGNPGTGKTVVARLLGEIFWALGIRSRNVFVEVSDKDIISAYNEGDTIQNMQNAIGRAMGGVLFIDEVYTLAENDWGKKALEVLMKAMEDHRDELTVIMAGYAEKLPELYKVNPGLKSRVPHRLDFPDYTADQLLQMFHMRSRQVRLTLSSDADTKLRRYIESIQQRGGMDNGRGVRNLFDRARTALAQARTRSNEITADMIPEPLRFQEAEARAALDEIEHDFIGLQRVKEFLQKLYVRQSVAAVKGGKDKVELNHCVFLGNPGTGKTSVARKMGKLFHYMGLITERDKLIEIDPMGELLSQYQAQYAEKTRDCFDRAIGGVLFIDEAYQLAKDDQGRKVIDQMVKLITEPKYANLVVVLAGYTDEMQQFLKVNAGLKRRFPHEVYFDDFRPEELMAILQQCIARDGHHVSESDRASFETRAKSLLSKMSRKRYFGNAGAVQEFYSNTIKVNQGLRLLRDGAADKFEIRTCDVTGNDAPVETIEDILGEMEEKFVGLEPVKQRVRDLAMQLRFDKRREEQLGLPPSQRSKLFNMRFVGSPGTGKTTIARYMSRVFYALGIVSQPDRVVETRGVDLTGSYVGQTKDKVNQLFENAAGRVIVIDEVYALHDPSQFQTDSFGQEAIDTLVGAITDPTNEDIVIVLAGYKDKMDQFLTANAGLASRFPHEIVFPDYSDHECVEILRRMLQDEKFCLERRPDLDSRLVSFFAEARQMPGFGNARTVAAVFDRLKTSVGHRVLQMESSSPEDYSRILPCDVDALFQQS
jgi:SpoVK/Ycf46/Vps4 family AAA+-type ATPase